MPPVLAKRIPLPREGNRLFPLPPDFNDLTAEGQRQARVAALRQFALYRPMAADPAPLRRQRFVDRATALYHAVNFFDRYYLWPQGEYDPGFYDMEPSPSPAYHDQISINRALHGRLFFVGPRGSAKTGYWKKAIASSMIAVPKYSWFYITSMDDLTTVFGDDVKNICYENPRVRDDFDPEYGPLKPKRGEKRTAMHGFALANGSSLDCSSAQARKRGKRPVEIAVDDPEWDPSQSTPMEVLRTNCHLMLIRVLLPMIQRRGCRCTWTGTFISRKHYLWHAMSVKQVETPEGVRETAVDPRFRGWARMIQPAEYTNDAGVRESCWPYMWPINEAQKVSLNLDADTRSLDEIKEELGEPAYNAEYKCQPDTADSGYMPPLTQEAHGYTLSKFDANFEKAPWKSATLVTFHRAGKLLSVPLHELLATSTGVIQTADPANTAGVNSDFKCSIAWCITDHNELFVFDIFHDQVEDPDFEEAMLRMADRWHTVAICPEDFGLGASTARSLEQSILQRIDTVLHLDHLPEIVPIKPPGSKCSRIASSRWRFQHGLVKLPWDLCDDITSAWHVLKYQIENFQNRGGDDTGLEKDDAIDCLSQSGAATGVPTLPAEAEPPKSDKQLFLEGADTNAQGQSLHEHVLPFLSRAELQQALLAREDRARAAAARKRGRNFSAA